MKKVSKKPVKRKPDLKEAKKHLLPYLQVIGNELRRVGVKKLVLTVRGENAVVELED
jgi:hypothetical protein